MHTVIMRTKPPTTPKIMGVLFEDFICLPLAGPSTGRGGSTLILKKVYIS
jgi:hypothetical protein